MMPQTWRELKTPRSIGIRTHLFSSEVNGMEWLISCTHICALVCVLHAIWKSKVACWQSRVCRRRRLGSTWLGDGAAQCVIFSSWGFFKAICIRTHQSSVSLSHTHTHTHTHNLFLSGSACSQSKCLFRQVAVCSLWCRISSGWLTGHICNVYGSDYFVFFG